MLDIGSSSVRAGYAGDDTPKGIIPTSYGYTEDASDEQDVSMGEAKQEDSAPAEDSNAGANPAPSSKKVKLHIGQHGPSLFRPNMQVGNPLSGGLSMSIPFDLIWSGVKLMAFSVEDFTPIPALIRNVLEDNLHANPTEHPILVTEPAWNTPDRRERMAEIMFEEFQVPAFYIANTGVLNS